MTDYQLTVDRDTLQQLFVGKDQLAHLVETVLNQVLQAQATEQLQAVPYERTDERRGYRNGYRSHHLTTRVGTLTLRVPQLREGQFSTELLARYQRSEQALMLTLRELLSVLARGCPRPQGPRRGPSTQCQCPDRRWGQCAGVSRDPGAPDRR